MLQRIPIVATVLAVLLTVSTAAQEIALVPRGAMWKYLDDGSDQGSVWRQPGYSDLAWRSGRSQLGYGDGDEATVVGFGPISFFKYVTTYFRHSFTVADPGDAVRLRLRLLRDDGAVVYLNGVEVARSNIFSFVTVEPETLAADDVSGGDEDVFHEYQIPTEHLRAGTNVLAVELHQSTPFSSDIGFDLELVADTRAVLKRGPYLQLGTPTSVTVKWRTDAPTRGRVRLGRAPDRLDATADEAAPTADHAVTLTGLTPGTRYHYSIGHGSTMLAGGDPADSFSFVTAPLPGTRQPTRVWVLGDSGTADAGAAAVRDAYMAFNGQRHTDLWLMLGDNAYSSGTDAEHQAAVFDMYPEMLRSSVLWPTRGNHEQIASTYFSIFTLPRAGEAGGMPSGTEAYYSFDHANVHFVCLDSFASNPFRDGAMWRWLESDLAATEQDWIVAFWHHPPYSKGSHDSDLEFDLIKMRTYFLPLLEEAGVDLVLAGHSHCYERSYLIDGHYGFSFQFDPSEHLKDGGNGRVEGDGAYHKAPIPHAGAVYCVAGSSGRASDEGSLDYPVMYYSVSHAGSLVLDVDGDRMDVSFVNDAAVVEDHFTLRKFAEGGLSGDTTTLSVSRGGSQHFLLDAGPAHAGKPYHLLGSLTGTEPGVALGGATLPLVFDRYTAFTFAHTNSTVLVGNRGQLDGSGRAAATLNLPRGLPLSLIGRTLFHAYAVFEQPGTTRARFASNPFPLTLVP